MHFHNCGKSQKLSKIYIIILAVIMIFSVFMASACQDTEDKGSVTSPSPIASTSPTPTPALVKNGNFEDTYETSYPKVPKYWTSLGDSYNGETASKTDSKTGVIDTTEENFSEIVKDIFNDENKLVNPNVAADAEEDDKNIIMIYNEKASAVKYKSQSITLPANAFGKVTVYVKTMDIAPLDKDNPDAYKYFGAQIAITSNNEPTILVSGIDTEKMASAVDENGWVKYEFYIEGSLTSSKTVYVELGLGSGSAANSTGYTSGFAFFDNVTLDYINYNDYSNSFEQFDLEENFFYYDALASSQNAYFKNRVDAKTATPINIFAYSFNDPTTMQVTSFKDIYSSLTKLNPEGNLAVDLNPNATEKKLVSVTDEEIFDGALKDYPFTSDQVLALNNKDLATQGYSFKIPNFNSIPPYELKSPENPNNIVYSHYRIGLFVKTSDFYNNGLNVALVHKNKAGANFDTFNIFNNINTTAYNISKEDLDTEANRHNKWANWKEYVFYIEASPYDSEEIELQLWLGPQNVTGLQISGFTEGYSLFSEFSIQKLTKTEYSSASSGDNIKSGIKLYSTSSPQIANSGFNTPSSPEAFGNITKTPVAPSSWSGYFGGYSKLIGDNNATIVENSKNTDVIKGIINENYLSEYKANGYASSSMTLSSITKAGKPNYLMIYNKNQSAYGFVSPLKTLSAESYYFISVSVKTFDGAKANIYLTDEDGKVVQHKDIVKETNLQFTNITDGAWVDYKFYIKTGELSKGLKIEIWSGDRAGKILSTGTVLFDDVVLASITEEMFNEVDPDTSTKVIKSNYEGIDIAPSETPATQTPSPSPSEPAVKEPFVFPWGLVTTLLTALALIFVLIVVAVRKIKSSKILSAKSVKVEELTYSRENLQKKLEKNRKAASKKAKQERTATPDSEELELDSIDDTELELDTDINDELIDEEDGTDTND